jgi:hypothetical protein
VLFKNNDQHSTITGISYESLERVLGSDHRPVTLSCMVTSSLNNYVDPEKLLNVTKPLQSYGVILMKNLILKFDTANSGLQMPFFV